jgi:hypothetical protein
MIRGPIADLPQQTLARAYSGAANLSVLSTTVTTNGDGQSECARHAPTKASGLADFRIEIGYRIDGSRWLCVARRQRMASKDGVTSEIAHQVLPPTTKQ